MALCAGPALAEGKFSDGLRHLNAGRYPEAVVSLAEAAEANPDSPRVHYYLGNALAFLGMYSDAVEEYSLAYYLEPYGRYAGYSQIGMQRFAAAAHHSIDTPGSYRMPQSRGMTEYNHLRGALAQIHKQIAEQKGRESVIHARLAREKMRVAAAREGAIRRRAQEEIADIRGMSRRLNRWQQAEINEINRVMQVRANFVRQHGRIASQRTLRNSYTRSAALEKSALSIQRQLAARPSRSGVVMQALGTNLYVRNYEHLEKPSLKATAYRLRTR